MFSKSTYSSTLLSKINHHLFTPQNRSGIRIRGQGHRLAPRAFSRRCDDSRFAFPWLPNHHRVISNISFYFISFFFLLLDSTQRGRSGPNELIRMHAYTRSSRGAAGELTIVLSVGYPMATGPPQWTHQHCLLIVLLFVGFSQEPDPDNFAPGGAPPPPPPPLAALAGVVSSFTFPFSFLLYSCCPPFLTSSSCGLE